MLRSTRIVHQFVLTRGYSAFVASVFPDRAQPPGLNDRLKLWWAKEVTPDYHVAGRLSERQIKYVAEGGFKSVLSLFKYGDEEKGDFGGDYLPTTKEAKEIVETQCGMQFAALLSQTENCFSVDAVKKMGAILPKLEKPVLLHSNRGSSVTFVLLMNLAYLSRNNPSFKPQIDSTRFYEITARMGLDFTQDFIKETVAQITGEPIIRNPPVTNVQPRNWFDYWMGHPVYKNWYTAGQITQSHMNVLTAAGFKSVVNMRAGMQMDGKPSQEEVNLINIREKTGTYATDNHKARQERERLEETRVFPLKPNSYISIDAKRNYENINEAEFGDTVGYNADLEKRAFENSTLNFCHFPVLVTGPYDPYFGKHLDKFVELGSEGPVLVHCARAWRAAYAAILSAGVQYDLSLDWALEKSRDLGYGISKDTTPDIYKVMEKYLRK